MEETGKEISEFCQLLSMRIRVKNYYYAGLDFIFDHKESPWFIEANGAPHDSLEFKQLYGKPLPVIKLAQFLKNKNNICVMSSKREKYDKNNENSLWIANELRNYLDTDIRICNREDNMKRYRNLIDNKRRTIIPDSIISFGFGGSILKKFNHISTIINPYVVNRIVKDKIKTIEIVKTHTKVNIPATFIVKNNRELKKLLHERPKIFEHGYIVKPIDQSLGHGVHVLTTHDRIPRITKPELLEQRITPKLIGRKYWDVRVFVVDGEFVGGIKRETIHRVTNITRGAKPYPLEKRLAKKLEKPALEVVKAIDREAELLKNLFSKNK